MGEEHGRTVSFDHDALVKTGVHLANRRKGGLPDLEVGSVALRGQVWIVVPGGLAFERAVEAHAAHLEDIDARRSGIVPVERVRDAG